MNIEFLLKEKKLTLLERYNYLLEVNNFSRATIYRAKLQLIDELIKELTDKRVDKI